MEEVFWSYLSDLTGEQRIICLLAVVELLRVLRVKGALHEMAS